MLGTRDRLGTLLTSDVSELIDVISNLVLRTLRRIVFGDFSIYIEAALLGQAPGIHNKVYL